jgi:hypothetical protein
MAALLTSLSDIAFECLIKEIHLLDIRAALVSITDIAFERMVREMHLLDIRPALSCRK